MKTANKRIECAPFDRPLHKQLCCLVAAHSRHRVASALDARVVGDDGEKYERGKTIFGKPKLVIRREA